MPILSKSEVRQHNTPRSAWIIIHNNVYDVTRWLRKHPGGADVLLQRAGNDATDGFEEVGHSCQARKMLEDYKIGSLPKDEREKFSRCDKSCLRPPKRRNYNLKDASHCELTPTTTLPPAPNYNLKDASLCELTPTTLPPATEPPILIDASRCDLTAMMAPSVSVPTPEEAGPDWKWLLAALLVLALAGLAVNKMRK